MGISLAHELFMTKQLTTLQRPYYFYSMNSLSFFAVDSQDFPQALLELRCLGFLSMRNNPIRSIPNGESM